MSDDLVLIDRHGPAALLTLNRPAKRNALSIELRVELAEKLTALADDPSVAATGVTGAGSARFGFPELGRHIPPSYAAAVFGLPPAVACDLCLTGRVIGAEEALSLGVVSRISAGGEALDDVANAPASATAEVKRRILLHRAGESPGRLLAEEERTLRAALLGERPSS